MNGWSPCKRREFIRKVRRLGFTGPYPGGKHLYMRSPGGARLALPHPSEYSVTMLQQLVREIEGYLGRSIDSDEWNSL